MKTHGLAILVGFVVAVSAWAASWDQFRGPRGSGVSAEKGLPTTWSKTEKVRWVADLPGRGLSNPVFVGNRVYVTASSGAKQDRLHVLCLDVKTGKQLWERQLWATGNTGSHPKTCMAAPSPATDGERIYALFATGDLACFHLEGDLLWYRGLVPDYPTISNQVGMAASPVVHGDVVLVPMENVGESFAAGIEKRTGQNRWKSERSRDIIWVTPLVVGDGEHAQALFQSRDEVTSFVPSTGAKRWSFRTEGLATMPSPVAAGPGRLLVPAASLTLVELPSGKGEPKIVWKNNKLNSGTASVLYNDGRVYSVNSAGILNCADAADGNILWQQRTEGPYSASPVLADGKVYLANEKGKVTVVQIGEKPEVLAVNDLAETFLATPAIADGAIFLRSDAHLWCISEAGRK